MCQYNPRDVLCMCVNSIQWVNKHGIHFAQLVLVNLNLSFAPICRLTAVSVTPHQQDTTQGDLLLKYLQKKLPVVQWNINYM